MKTDLYGWLFEGRPHGHESAEHRRATAPTIPCPNTGRALRVATVDAETDAICPRCSGQGRGAFISFVGDLRMAYACPRCEDLVWLPGV
jgi:hypothetical protein